MREILFRGKRIDNGEWVEGAFCLKDCDAPFGDMVDRPSIIKYDPPCDGFWFRIDPETVGQFTGLTDKNGKKIFEGDVLQFNYTGKNHGVEGKATVIFEHGKFGVLWGWHKEFVCLDGFANTTIEVIGNIHDNPELLENP